MTIVRNATVYVAKDHQSAVEDATRVFQSGRGGPAPSLEAYLQNAILGTPAECLTRIAEIESWGVNYLRVGFPSIEHQRQFAEQLLPLVTEERELEVSAPR